jgi:hypothetical protein
MNERMDKIITLKEKDGYISLGIFFLAAFGYFFFVANYVLYFQETQSLFVFSWDYIDKYLQKPGGLLEYTGRFITQFYAGKLAGSLILSVILTLPGVMLLFIHRRKFQGFSLSVLFILIPSCLLMLMQANYYHLVEYNIGIILILAYYLFSILSDNKFYKILVVVLWPLFYYLAGAYALIFALLHIIQNLLSDRGRSKYADASFMLLVAAISFLVFWKILFLQPVEHVLFFPLPLLENTVYKFTFFMLVCYLIFYPVICSSVIFAKYKWLNKRIYLYMSVVFLSISSVFVLAKIYSIQTARVIELERLIFNEKWEEAIRFQEKKPARNLIGEYFYNIALSESGQLCDRLFNGYQDFGSGSLVLPWGDEHLNRGAYFYYSVGLINEAHRWAYEEMVVYGYRPQNIKLLAKTCLINGDFRMARKYINILKRTIYYRDLATRYEKMADNPDLISSDPELYGKSKILPKSSFFIQFNEPQNNLPLLLSSQPENMKAFEYYMAGLLLTKNVEAVMNNVGKMKEAGYTRIPRFIEEAVLIYHNSTKIYPDLGGLEVSSDTRERFAKYFAAYVTARKNASTLKEKMEEGFGDTFWFYFHFK